MDRVRRLTIFYSAAIIEAVAAFEAGVGATSTPLISAASPPVVYAITYLNPGEDIESTQEYSIVDQDNKRGMVKFCERFRVLTEIRVIAESWRTDQEWRGKPHMCMQLECDMGSVTNESHRCRLQGEERLSDQLLTTPLDGQRLDIQR